MGADAAGNIQFQVDRAEEFAEGCGSWQCELPGAIFDPAVVTAAVLLAVLVVIGFTYVQRAKTRCEDEKRRVERERQAFGEFADRVAGLEAAFTDGGTRRDRTLPAGSRVGTAPEDGRRIDGVLDAYRDTVMAVPHYTEEYDDSPIESLAEELSYDVATAVATREPAPAGLREALVTQSRQAQEQRDRLADAIDDELDELDAVESKLSRLDREREALAAHLDESEEGHRFEAHADVWGRLESLEDRCGAVAAERQRQLRDPPLGNADTEASFYRYLYGPLEGVTYPVLAECASLARLIREDRRRIERRLADPA